MEQEYRATQEQWAMLEERSAPEYDNTILELRARVEVLEAGQQDEEADIADYYAALSAQHQGQAVFHDNSKPTPNPSQIRSSLVERVQGAIHDVEFPHGDDEARAAIREVAAWMIDRKRDDDWLAPFDELADLLQEEANR